MKKLFILFISICLASCGTSTELNKEFDCGTKKIMNLKKMKDFKKNFTIKLPKNWKTNYYYNDVVSSIHGADTTLNLTKSFIFKASFILNPIPLDQDFIDKIKSDNERMKLEEVKSKLITFKNKPAYYNLAKGKNKNFDYQIFNVFIKEDTGFIQVKTEIYGDLLINERLCEAVNLINGIETE